MKKLILSAFILGSVFAFCGFNASAVDAGQKYHVYCSRGKIDIDMRDPAKMKSDRGDAFLLGTFDSRIDAEKLAKKHGGVGAKCKGK